LRLVLGRSSCVFRMLGTARPLPIVAWRAFFTDNQSLWRVHACHRSAPNWGLSAAISGTAYDRGSV